MSAFICQCYAEKILQQLWHDCENEELCDVVLIAGNEDIRIPAHRNILSAASTYFKGMFKSSMRESTTKEIQMSSASGAILRSLVEYCYTGRVAFTEDNAVELLKLADFLQLSDVVTDCGDFLSEQLHPSNCLGLALFADQHRCEILLKKAKDYSLEQFMDVCKTHEFLSLNSEQLGEFLADNNLNARAEENVFESLMTWIQHDQIEREKHKDQLLKLVRLPLLERSFLIQQVKPICTSTDSFQLYVDALEWNLLPHHKIINAGNPINSKKFLMCLTIYPDRSRMQIHYNCPQRLKWMRCLKDLEYRSEFGVAIMDDSLFVVGGSSREGFELNTVICINLKTMTIGQINPMRECREGCGAAVVNGILHAVGGLNGNNSLSSVEKWDPKTKSWSRVASMSVRRNSFGIAQLNDKLYAVGGYCDGDVLTSAEYYDVHQNVWKSIAPTNDRRDSTSAVVVNGLLYVVGDGNTVERYDARINKWTMLCKLSGIEYGLNSCITFCNKLVIYNQISNKFHEYNDKFNERETKEISNGIEHACCLIAYSGELLISEFAEN